MKHRLKAYAQTIAGKNTKASIDHNVPPLSQLLKYLTFVLIAAIIFGWYIVIGPSSSYTKGQFDQRQNAVWAQHAWSEQKHTPEEIRDFVETLGKNHIRYAYLHVGPLESDGRISPERYAQLSEFLKVARMYSDRIMYIPWLGQIRNKLPLDSLAVRTNIVNMTKIFVNDFNMSGVHFDIEPIVDNDSDFLFLLEDVRKAIGSDKIISVALSEYFPSSVIFVVRKFMHVSDSLSREYLRKIDSLANQLVIMTYENSIRDGRFYRYFLKNEIIWLTNILKESKLIIGLPTYDTESDTFHPKAENIDFGLRGVIDGLSSWRSRREVFEGVALYGYWTTEKKEWDTMNVLFLN